MEPKVYIVIVNYAGWQDTIDCLESLSRSRYAHFQVAVVDNHSPNDSVARIRQWLDRRAAAPAETAQPTTDAPLPLTYALCDGATLDKTTLATTDQRVLLIQAPRNGGFAAGNNVFLRLLEDEDAYVWLLNPDMTVEPDTLPALVAEATRRPREVVVGCVVRSFHNPAQVLEFGGSRINFLTGTASTVTSPEDVHRIDYISGGTFFTHAGNFKRYGLLPEKYFLYWEETDWCYGAHRQGLVFAVCASAVCYDKIGTSIGRGFLAEYYYSLNALRFMKKYAPGYIPGVLFFNVFRMGKRLVQGKFDRMRAISKASLDFLSGRYGLNAPR